ncbi:hypothetical protein LW858_29390 (plasmid) [Bacillus cereus]|uniref:hypothetical protein n=1 Tax=Bacillus cereus TaxID=1396 RepID=UPI001F179051|nr:hypothetical protein [Bacillus cereus]UIJ69693.1 hypothetical protein LW858_29390 [Bacillus cereus]
MQKHYKKLAVVIPLTSMSAIAPVTSFAAETQKADISSSQEGLIQGYQMENGKITALPERENPSSFGMG